VEEAGPRFRIRFLETRHRGGKTTTIQPCVLTMHAGDKPAHVFVGAQVPLRTSDKGVPTVAFRNAGVQVDVRALQALPDGRFRLEASYEEAGILASSGGAPSPLDNPVLQVIKGESSIVLRAGETAPFTSAVDPLTGEVVNVDVALEAAPMTPAAGSATGREERLRARFVLNRRRGDTRVASRPYAVVVQPDAPGPANVFSGSMLPLETSYQGQPTVMLKDIGAGMRLTVHRAAEGRYRLALSISDGVLAPAAGSSRVQAFQAESNLYLRPGETVLVASAIDPQTDEVVEAELTLEAGR
jgi:hypothetical protein